VHRAVGFKRNALLETRGRPTGRGPPLGHAHPDRCYFPKNFDVKFGALRGLYGKTCIDVAIR
jgi:hypothetical protein